MVVIMIRKKDRAVDRAGVSFDSAIYAYQPIEFEVEEEETTIVLRMLQKREFIIIFGVTTQRIRPFVLRVCHL